MAWYDIYSKVWYGMVYRVDIDILRFSPLVLVLGPWSLVLGPLYVVPL